MTRRQYQVAGDIRHVSGRFFASSDGVKRAHIRTDGEENLGFYPANGGRPEIFVVRPSAVDRQRGETEPDHMVKAVRALTAKMDEAMEQIATGEEVEGRDDARDELAALAEAHARTETANATTCATSASV